jgi:hypothetical protein
MKEATMSAPVKIKVVDVIGSNLGVSSEDGGAVFEKIQIALNARQSVELDFTGIDMLISAFLNAAVGKLVEKLSVEEIHQRVKFTGMADGDPELLEKVLENAHRYYEDPDRFRKLLEMEVSDEE